VAQIFPRWEPTDQLDAPNRRLPESRVGRFAKAVRHHTTGQILLDFGPFFVGNLVGVGCRMMTLGPRLGTLVGTLEPMPLCAHRVHDGLR
jgi:hypothetical protein